MHPHKLPVWLQKIVATMGGGGLFLLAFLDSSVLSFPFVTDALVIQLSFVNPKRMPYYAGMAAIGSTFHPFFAVTNCLTSCTTNRTDIYTTSVTPTTPQTPSSDSTAGVPSHGRTTPALVRRGTR